MRQRCGSVLENEAFFLYMSSDASVCLGKQKDGTVTMTCLDKTLM